MNEDQKKRRHFLIHPILFGIYPVLALYFYNRHEIVFFETQQALLTSFVLSSIIIAGFFAIFRSWSRASIPITFTLVLFYSYGHVFDALKNIPLLGEIVGRHRFIITIWVLIFIVGCVVFYKSKEYTRLNEALNIVSIFLIVFLLLQAFIYVVQSRIAAKNVPRQETQAQENLYPEPASRDVYYILVDAYSRDDLLLEHYNLDISDFLGELENLGFYIPDCAQSNYGSTVMSMTSVLNMAYLDTLDIQYDADTSRFAPYIQENLVLQKFKSLDYQTATFKSLFPAIDIKDVDYYYDHFSETSTFDSHAGLNFQHLFLRTTLIRPLLELVDSKDDWEVSPLLYKWLPLKNSLDSREFRQYQQSLFALDSLENFPDIDGNKFIYAHLYVTHQPLVFNPDGRFHSSLAQDNNAYRNQVIFLNRRLLEIVKNLLEKSDPSPIIVIQSDHSYVKGEDSVRILNAYYLPDDGNAYLYETVTSVNTF